MCEEDEPEPLADGDALGSPSVPKIEVGRLNRGKVTCVSFGASCP